MRKNPRHQELCGYAQHAVDNEIEILESSKCGCYFCRSVFDARKVQDWLSDERGTSALCPECGMDAVIGDASGVPIEKPLLKEMNLEFFGESFMEGHPEALETYCKRYIEGKITHKPHNEELFLKYLNALSEKGNTTALLTIGHFYQFGSEFTPADPMMALSYYESPLLDQNAEALIARGQIHYILQDIDDASWNAYECFSKAAALGSYEGVFELANCYFDGIYVKKDAKFAFHLLCCALNDVYTDFCGGKGSISTFIDYCYRLGLSHQLGLGTEKNHYEALRLFLCAEFGFEMLKAQDGAVPNQKMLEDTRKRIKTIAKEYGYHRDEPVFDQDTFYDTFSDQQDFGLPKGLNPVSFDEKEGVLDFQVTYFVPPLIIDIASLYCGFVDGTICWKFTDVAYFKAGEDKIFERLSSPDQDTWHFEHMEPGSDKVVTIAELRFRSDPREVKDIVKKKGKNSGKK